MTVEGKLDSLLLVWQQQRAQGQDVQAADLCADCPELADELGRRIEVLRRIGDLTQPADVAGPWAVAVALPSPEHGNGHTEPGPSDALTSGDRTQVASENQPRTPRVLGGISIGPTPESGRGGRHFGKFALLERIGRGGMGVVYKARDLSTGRLVALKRIRSESQAGADEVAAFRREAQAAMRFDHPGVVPVYEIGQIDEEHYYTMALVEGGSLEKRLAGRPLEARAAAGFVKQIAEAVQHAHDQGVLHRDLKPHNVLLQKKSEDRSRESGENAPGDGSGKGSGPEPSDSHASSDSGPLTPDTFTPRLTDFGLARLQDQRSGLTVTGHALGTPAYMPPEQALGQHDKFGPPLDVYALGATLYQLLTGRPPFQGVTAADTIQLLLNQEPMSPRALNPSVPRDLETLSLKCLAKDPARRYPTAAALAQDLGRFLAHEPILARPAGWIERGVKWCRRRPLAGALATVSILTLVSVFAGIILYARYQEQARTTVEDQLSRELQEKEQFRALLKKSQEALAGGEAFFASGQLERAKTELVKALAHIGDDARLQDLRLQARALLERAETRLADQGRYPRFRDLQDQALFFAYCGQITTRGRDDNLHQTRDLSAKALKLYGIDKGAELGSFLATSTYNDVEKTDIASRCYELLLTQAMAVVQRVPGEDEDKQAHSAMLLLKQAAQLRPPTPAWHECYADCAHLLKGAVKAPLSDQAEKVLLTESGSLDLFLAGQRRYREQDLAGAIALFRHAIDGDPNHFWAHFLIGLSYLNAQRPTDAQASFSVCQGLRPGFVWTYLLRGLVNGELGAQMAMVSPAEANLHFQAADADFAKAQKIVDDDEARYVLLVNRGVVRLQEGKADQAIADFQQAAKVRPQHYQTYLNLAEAYRQSHAPHEALDCLNRALAIQPDLPGAYRSRARLLLQGARPNLEAALKDLDSAVLHARDARDVVQMAADHKERGLILVELNREKEALLAFDTALKVRPDYVVAHRLRAELLMEQQRYEEAVQSWNVYLQAARLALAKFVQAKEPVANAFRARGVAWARLGKPAAALDDYTRALELEEDSVTFAFRGWVYVVSEAPHMALRDFQKALALDPTNADAYNGRGWCRLHSNQYRQAVADAEEALRLGKHEPRLLYNAARIHAQAFVKAEMDPAMANPKGADQALSYQSKALALLREAMLLSASPAKQKSFWTDFVAGDAALASLRRSEEYHRLAAQFAARPPTDRIKDSPR